MKSYTTGAKRYWMAWTVKLPLKKGPHADLQISPKEGMEVNSLFVIIKAK